MLIWCGHRFDLVATLTTGDWYRSLYEIVAPQNAMLGAGVPELSREAVDACYAFCSELIAWKGRTVDRDVLAMMQQKYNEGREVEDYELVYPHLYNACVASSGWGLHTPAIDAFYKVVTQSEKFDAGKSDGPCACEECCGRAEFDDGCLFRQEPITSFARQLGAVSPELVSQYWDRPLYLYRHAQIAETHRGMRLAAMNQERKSNTESPERREAREMAHDDIRRKYPEVTRGR